MSDQRINNSPDGAPLAVCVNDCELDYGQSHGELMKVCFRLGCAFAEMRWGAKPVSEIAPIFTRRTHQIQAFKLYR